MSTFGHALWTEETVFVSQSNGNQTRASVSSCMWNKLPLLSSECIFRPVTSPDDPDDFKKETHVIPRFPWFLCWWELVGGYQKKKKSLTQTCAYC